MLNRCIEFCLLLSLGAGVARAQQPLVTQTIDSGAAVRLGLTRDTLITGRLLAPLTPESKVVALAPMRGRCGEAPSCRIEVAAADVKSVEIRRSKAVKGAIIGGLFGVAVGLTIGNSLNRYEASKCPPGSVPCEEGLSDAATVSLTTLIGIGLGATAGAVLGSDTPNWRPAP